MKIFNNIISFLLIIWKNNPSAVSKLQPKELNQTTLTQGHLMPHVVSCQKFPNIFQSFCLFLVFFHIKRNIFNINLINITNSHGLKHLTFLWFIQNIFCFRTFRTPPTPRSLDDTWSWKLVLAHWLKSSGKILSREYQTQWRGVLIAFVFSCLVIVTCHHVRMPVLKTPLVIEPRMPSNVKEASWNLHS